MADCNYVDGLDMSIAALELASKLGLPKRVEVMGAPIDPWTMEQTVEAADYLISNGRFAHLIGVNADKLLQMRDDPWMNQCVNCCEIVNADGASMVMAARRLGKYVPERVAGIDLMYELCRLAEQKNYSIYLLGAKRPVVEKTNRVLRDQFPGLNIVGFRDGYFSDEEIDTIIDRVAELKPNIVFVGITSPKKEHLIERFRERGGKGAYVGVGGSFDVVSGNIPRAPIWMQRLNLEWLFRMAQEPQRLVKRYFVGNMRFFGLLLKEILKRKE